MVGGATPSRGTMFGSVHFRKIFFIRFLGYFLIQVGLITIILIAEPVINEELKFRIDQLFNRHYVLPNILTSTATTPQPSESNITPTTSPSQNSEGGFGDLMFGGSEMIVPVSTDFGIVIEKINANARVIPNVDPSNERDYMNALAQGVAHAKGTVFPGQKGNIYLFSHSTDAPWNVVRYNAIFYLLGKLEVGDRIIMFYQGRRFDYIVFDKTIASPQDTHFLTDTYNESVLTLQTCDPPGTTLNRLIIRAKLAKN